MLFYLFLTISFFSTPAHSHAIDPYAGSYLVVGCEAQPKDYYDEVCKDAGTFHIEFDWNTLCVRMALNTTTGPIHYGIFNGRCCSYNDDGVQQANFKTVGTTVSYKENGVYKRDNGENVIWDANATFERSTDSFVFYRRGQNIYVNGKLSRKTTTTLKLKFLAPPKKKEPALFEAPKLTQQSPSPMCLH